MPTSFQTLNAKTNITKQINQKQISILFKCCFVAKQTKTTTKKKERKKLGGGGGGGEGRLWLTQKIRMLCFVIINSVVVLFWVCAFFFFLFSFFFFFFHFFSSFHSYAFGSHAFPMSCINRTNSWAGNGLSKVWVAFPGYPLICGHSG